MPVFQGSPRAARQPASNQARQVGPRAGAAKRSKIIRGHFSAEAGKFRGPSYCLPEDGACTASVVPGWGCRRALPCGLGLRARIPLVPESLLSLIEGCSEDACIYYLYAACFQKGFLAYSKVTAQDW